MLNAPFRHLNANLDEWRDTMRHQTSDALNNIWRLPQNLWSRVEDIGYGVLDLIANSPDYYRRFKDNTLFPSGQKLWHWTKQGAKGGVLNISYGAGFVWGISDAAVNYTSDHLSDFSGRDLNQYPAFNYAKAGVGILTTTTLLLGSLWYFPYLSVGSLFVTGKFVKKNEVPQDKPAETSGQSEVEELKADSPAVAGGERALVPHAQLAARRRATSHSTKKAPPTANENAPKRPGMLRRAAGLWVF
jgi:hypothetical protein